jgi:dimeric dUTPase (all-alpha-NTP-PPase superfamily)
VFDSLHRQAIVTMLGLQNKMNTKVHPDWINQGYAWYRAAWIECAELMDHQGYKWWKKQQADVEQVQLEVIDIWHFGMSAKFTPGADIENLADDIVAELSSRQPNPSDVLTATEALAANCLATKGFSVALFWDLLESAGLDFNQLYKQYVGKNVLNFFRQDHGYKDGSYIKVWAGQEDNEHLSEIMSELDMASEDFAGQVYQALQQRYPTA